MTADLPFGVVTPVIIKHLSKGYMYMDILLTKDCNCVAFSDIPAPSMFCLVSSSTEAKHDVKVY